MLRNVIQFAQSYGLIPATILVAAIIYWLFGLLGRRKERQAVATLADMAALGEVVPDTLHPKIDPNRCIGSGACVTACPEKDVIAVVSGVAVLVNPLACVGHSACVDACPVAAVSVVFGTATRGVELPKIDRNFETHAPGRLHHRRARRHGAHPKRRGAGQAGRRAHPHDPPPRRRRRVRRA